VLNQPENGSLVRRYTLVTSMLCMYQNDRLAGTIPVGFPFHQGWWRITKQQSMLALKATCVKSIAARFGLGRCAYKIVSPQQGTTMEQLIIQLISGAVGGNVAGGVMKNLSLGTLGNSIAGIVGGGVGGQILSAVMGGTGGGGLDIGSILTQVAGGGVGGGIALAIVGVVKNMMAK
jgi:hypothetical protein